MGRTRKWSKQGLIKELEESKAHGDKYINVNQTHTDEANNLKVEQWLQELGYKYEVKQLEVLGQYTTVYL